MNVESLPKCSSALIVGTGLIGTSVGMCLAEQGVRVGLQDVDRQAERDAAKQGAGEPHVPGAQYDLAVVAVPPSEVAAEVGRLLADNRVDTITDVASTKGRIPCRSVWLGPKHRKVCVVAPHGGQGSCRATICAEGSF